MDFSEKIRNAEVCLRATPETAAANAEQALQLCRAIKSCLKHTEDCLRIYPTRWEGVSSEAHRRFCDEIADESSENNDILELLTEKLNAVAEMYGKSKDIKESDSGLPASIL